MIVFVALLGLITLLGVQKRKKEEPFLSKEMTTTVNGIFVLCIFLTIYKFAFYIHTAIHLQDSIEWWI